MTDSVGVIGSLDDASSLGHMSEDRDGEGTRTSHQEHLRLAGIVKGVHADLRNKYKRSSGIFVCC